MHKSEKGGMDDGWKRGRKEKWGLGGGEWRRGLGEEQNGLRGRVKRREGKEEKLDFNILSLTWGHLRTIEREREREADRQIDRGRERLTGRQTGIQTGRQTNRQKERCQR